MRRLENLTDLQQEIIKSLKSRSDAMSIKEIQDFLQGEDYQTNLKNINNELKELIKYGEVRGKIEKGGRKYFLSRGIGAGYRKQASLMGKTNPLRDTYRMLKRWFGGIFLLIGLGIFVYQNSSISGAVIVETANNQTTPLISSLLFIIAGIFLLFKSFRKN